MTKSRLTEIQIVTGCRENDRQAQEALYRQHFPVMHAMCKRHISDDHMAMQVLNDGMLRVFKKIDQYEGKGSLEGWIRRVVYHAICNHYQSKSNYVTYLILEDYDSPIKADAEEQSRLEDLMKLINGLPSKTAEVFRLYAIEGYKHREIAAMLGMTSGTSKWHLSEARKLLRNQLTQSGYIENHGA